MNSSPEDGGLAACVPRSLDILRRECPEAYLRVCSSLARLVVALEVDGERVVLGFRPEHIDVLSADERADVDASTTRATIAHLYDGRLTIGKAIVSDAVLLKGRVDDLVGFHDALLDYVRGAARCPSFPPLVAAYRSPLRPSDAGRSHIRPSSSPTQQIQYGLPDGKLDGSWPQRT
jgi:hypothetical protein